MELEAVTNVLVLILSGIVIFLGKTVWNSSLAIVALQESAKSSKESETKASATREEMVAVLGSLEQIQKDIAELKNELTTKVTRSNAQ